MSPKVKKIEHENLSFVDLSFFFLLDCKQLKNQRVYMNIIHIKWPLCHWRCFFSGFEVGVSNGWWGAAPNTHHCHFLIHKFIHFSSITQKLRPPEHYHVACKSEVVGQNVGVVCSWVGQEVDVAMDKMFASFLSLIYTTTIQDAAFWKHLIYGWSATARNIHC